MSHYKPYLAFYIANQGRLLDRTISFIDGSRFSHCELVILNCGYSIMDCISSSHRDGGLRRKNIEMNPNKWVLMLIDCDVDYAKRWLAHRLGFKYDYLGLVRTKIPFVYNPEYRVFCSEACAAMLELVDPASYGIKKLYQFALDNPPMEHPITTPSPNTYTKLTLNT